MADFILAVLKYLFIFIVIWVVLSYFVSPRRTFGNIIKTWYQTFANQQFSAKEFYTLLEQAIEEKKIMHVSINRVTYRDSSYLASRVYLQIFRNNQMILVCAAGFGTDYYISYRQGQPVDFLQDMVMRIPRIGKLMAELMAHKTFYQQDTDVMFQEAVHECVLKAIDRLTSTKTERIPLEPTNKSEQSDIQYL